MKCKENMIKKMFPGFMTNIKLHIGIPALVLAAAGFAYFLLSAALIIFGGFRFLPRVMAWNLFLAMLPLIFAILVRLLVGRRRTAFAVPAGVLWLLFFPNAPYMITDLIHLHLFEYYGSGMFLQDFPAWAWLFYMITGIMLGLIKGMMSLEVIQEEVFRRRGRRAACLMVIAVSLISGYAVYIGRFLRLNSWDIIRPWSLVQRLILDFEGFAAAFSCMAAVCILLIYGLFHLIYAARRQECYDPIQEKG